MKVIVDKMPEISAECVFSKWELAGYRCKLNKQGFLCYLESCPYLQEIGDYSKKKHKQLKV